MVAFRRGAVLVTTAYLLGIVFLASPTLSPILFGGKAVEADYDRVEQYLGGWWEAPASVKLLLHADIALCLIALSSKFVTYTEQAWYFDGASIVLMIVALALYISSLIPGLKMLNPNSLQKAGPISRFLWREARYEAIELVAPGSADKPLTPPERRETIAIAAATIILIGVVLTGVVLMQAGEVYTLLSEKRQLAAMQEVQKKKE